MPHTLKTCKGKEVIIIDFNAIAISNIIAQKMALEEDLIRHMILNSIRMYRKRYVREFGEVVIVSDSGKSWRHQVFPQYKAKRRQSRNESPIDWKEVFRITTLVLQELSEYFPYKVITVPNCEADDIIAQLVESTQIDFGIQDKVMIVSSDKDFGQLQKYSNVRQYSPMLKKEIVIENPRQQLQEMILKGDQVDGIPNILSPDNCFVDNIRQSKLTAKKIQEITDNLPIDVTQESPPEWYRNYQRNKTLIDLSEIPDGLKQQIINTYNQIGDRSENKRKVMNYLITKRCRLLIEVVGDFI